MPRYFLVAGIDFGTSYTKVVLRDNNTPTSQARVVEFPGIGDGLLPSLVGFSQGRLSPPQGAGKGSVLPYLKMVAAYVAHGMALDRNPIRMPADFQAHCRGRSPTECLRDTLAYYFAHVMAATERFIRIKSPWRDFADEHVGGQDLLIFQLAVPSGLLTGHAATERLFRDALVAGYELRGTEGCASGQSIAADEWSAHVASVFSGDRIALEERYRWQCLIYPEVAAAVQTVFRSPNASEGLHITMDVGAGTVDLNAFRRISRTRTSEREGHRELQYYAASVAPLGVQHLNDPHGVMARTTESDLMEKLATQVRQLYFEAQKQQPSRIDGDPTYNPWNNTTIYLFGGGAHHPGYKQCLARTLHYACRLKNPVVHQLPKAADLALSSASTFGRFAVAYGLSFYRANLDRIKLPHELTPFRQLYPAIGKIPLANHALDD